MNVDSTTHTSVSEFLKKSEKHLGMSQKRTRDLLLFYEKDHDKFPLFPLINGRVYISHRTTYLIYILLHAIVYKDLFDRETEKRSKEFEKNEVKIAFENMGWNYAPNKIDKKKPSLEIDGIAVSQRQIIVVECKGWKLSPFYERENAQSYLERDIKGVVDGQKFTSGKARKIPSLVEKIEFVRTNMAMWGYKPKDFDEVIGLIVTRSFPPISQYKGIQILSIKDIPKKFDLRKI
jgi:hypothetical protein